MMLLMMMMDDEDGPEKLGGRQKMRTLVQKIALRRSWGTTMRTLG